VAIGYRRVDLKAPLPLRPLSLPAYFVFTSGRDLAQVYGTECTPEDLDWGREFMVVAQRAECPTGGYGVAIEDISRDLPHRLTVRVSSRDPAPDDFVTMMITFPRAAAVVGRRGLEAVREVIFADPGGKVLETVEVKL